MRVEDERAEDERVEDERVEDERVEDERVEDERVEDERVEDERRGEEGKGRIGGIVLWVRVFLVGFFVLLVGGIGWEGGVDSWGVFFWGFSEGEERGEGSGEEMRGGKV